MSSCYQHSNFNKPEDFDIRIKRVADNLKSVEALLDAKKMNSGTVTPTHK